MNYHHHQHQHQHQHWPGQYPVPRVPSAQHPSFVLSGMPPPPLPTLRQQQQHPYYHPSAYYYPPPPPAGTGSPMYHHRYQKQHQQQQPPQPLLLRHQLINEPKKVPTVHKPNRYSAPLASASNDDDIPLAILQRNTSKRHTQNQHSQQRRSMSQFHLAPGNTSNRVRNTQLSTVTYHHQHLKGNTHPARLARPVSSSSTTNNSSRFSLVSQHSSSSVTTSSSDSNPPPSTPPSPLLPQDHAMVSRPSIAKRLFSRLSRSATSTTLSSVHRVIAKTEVSATPK